MWLGIVTLLLCTSVSLQIPDGEKLRPLDNAKCWCNFQKMSSELRDLNKPDSNHAEQVFSFVHTLVSLNFKLNIYFTEFRQCIRFWLNTVRQCDASCSCTKNAVCCRNTALSTLDTGLLTIKNQVKQSFTAYSNVQFLTGYYDTTLPVVNAFSNWFFEFMTALKSDKVRAESEMTHFRAFFKRVNSKQPLDAIFDITMLGENGTKSVITRLADHYQCDTTKVLPFYLNVYGVLMQFLFMRELQEELQTPSGQESRSQFGSETEWKNFLKLTDKMTKQIIFCSSKQIYAIRSQEIKDKDMAMRNAAIVFSCFLLALVIIIGLIAFFACRSKRENTLTVREQPIQKTLGARGHDSLLKRYYETDESI